MGCSSSIKIKSKNPPKDVSKDDAGRSKTTFSTEVVQDVAGIHVDQKETEDAEAKTLLEEEETQNNKADSSREESKDLPGVPDFRDADNAWEGES
ncbi:hypothetical protein AGOR_G00102690 [Albula goreensis]|uniref:Uncharacterized protein n=1 Tax=Albula goreensis TaxID=1534307 RepID=A0A8T3DJ74_9TELE|nr:hypothetical protein AGOR_G00102690 [Albula goreensis]